MPAPSSLQSRTQFALFETAVPAVAANRAAAIPAWSGQQPLLWLCCYLPGASLAATDLQRLAALVLNYTPTVSIEPPDALLLEVRGSLKLFGGLAALRERVLRDLAADHHPVVTSCAPTATAALWLARAAGSDKAATPAATIITRSDLPDRLAPLSVQCTGWPDKSLLVLAQMGVTTLGECHRLPRHGFARRLGPKLLVELDRAYGRRPELRQPFLPPARFHAALDMPTDATATGLLGGGFGLLLAQLRDWLRARQAGVQLLWCRLVYRDGSDGWLKLALRQPTADTALLRKLLSMRLETISLGVPVTGIELQADVAPDVAPVGRDLLGRELVSFSQLSALLERLRARFGSSGVHGLAVVAEHRPELAWRATGDPLQAAGHASSPAVAVPAGTASRPCWLLQKPLLLQERGGQPLFQGPLDIETGPERIETGWWDGGDVRRDYYVACNRRGTRCWIFSDRRDPGWYLHGIFG